MVPRDHGFGTSFIGLSNYLLHDKRDEDAPEAENTDERVAWTYCHNLGTQNAETAFRVMAACAMDKTRLRQQAHERAQAELPEEERKPFRNSGRKSNDDVWHFSLGWHKDDADELSRESMIEDALAALAVIGKENAKVKRGPQYAVEHQAVIVCHEEPDTKPHIHVVVNRVHPEHGLKLQDYNDWKRFSRWAQNYEEERKVRCHNRVANNQLRDELAARGERGVKVYGKGHLPYHLVKPGPGSVHRSPSNNNPDPAAAIVEEERKRNAELAEKGRRQAIAQQQALRDLRTRYQEQRASVREQSARQAAVERAKIYAKYQPEQTRLLQDQERKIEAFELRDHQLLGKTRNLMDAVKARWNVQQREEQGFKLSDYYRILSEEGEGMKAVKEDLFAQQRQFEIMREQQLSAVSSRIHQESAAKREQARVTYVADRAALLSQHAADNVSLKNEWVERKEAQKYAQTLAERLREPRRSQPPPMRQEFKEAATEPQRAETEGDGDERPAAPPPPADPIAKARAEMAAKQAHEAFQELEGKGHDPANDR